MIIIIVCLILSRSARPNVAPHSRSPPVCGRCICLGWWSASWWSHWSHLRKRLCRRRTWSTWSLGFLHFSTNESDITFMRCGWWRQAHQVPVQADRGKIVPLHVLMSLWESCGCPHADRGSRRKLVRDRQVNPVLLSLREDAQWRITLALRHHQNPVVPLHQSRDNNVIRRAVSGAEGRTTLGSWGAVSPATSK